jgi:hypothetical protein
MKLLLINGPPGSGKDTTKGIALKWVAIHFPHIIPCVERFSAPLKASFAAIMEADLDDDLLIPTYEDTKEKPIPLLANTSYRQFQIYLATHMKAAYGPDIFGKLFLSRIKHCTDDELSDTAIADDYREWLFIIPDCGFQSELDTVLASGRFAPEDILLLNMNRLDCAWDSREPVIARPPVRRAAINNTSTLDHLKTEVEHVLSQWITFPPLTEPGDAAHTEGNGR